MTAIDKKLRSKFPKCFCHPPVPLMIGITAAVREALYPNASEDSDHGHAVAGAIQRWTSTRDYLEACCKRDAFRYSLDGTRRGHVTDAQALYAAELLQRVP